jgi:hypothetical protein
MAGAWTRPGVADDLRRVGASGPFALLSLYVGGPEEMARYARDAPVQTDDRMALEFSAPLAVLAGTRTTHAAALRALLDATRRPAALEAALAHATGADWRDRGTMLM